MSIYNYEKYWKDQDRQMHQCGALRAKHLAEEIIVGWTDQTYLEGDEHTLTMHALEYFSEAIQSGVAETHHDEFARDTIALCSRTLSWDMHKGENSALGYDETMLAARALKAFSEHLQGRLDELPPEPALAA
jgi:hypothetical protein